MPYNMKYVLVTLQKSKVDEGPSGSPQRKKKEVELKAPSLPFWSPIVGLDDPWAFDAATQ